jgi:hypothetical protein
MRAWTVPALFQVPNIQDAYDESGNPADKASSDERAANFINELLWCIEAQKKDGRSTSNLKSIMAKIEIRSI